jgi:hypothetical protein
VPVQCLALLFRGWWVAGLSIGVYAGCLIVFVVFLKFRIVRVPLSFRCVHYIPHIIHAYHHHCLYYLTHIYYLSKFICKINMKHSRYVSEIFLSSLNIKHTTQRFERKLPSSSSENFSLENECKLLVKISDSRRGYNKNQWYFAYYTVAKELHHTVKLALSLQYS